MWIAYNRFDDAIRSTIVSISSSTTSFVVVVVVEVDDADGIIGMLAVRSIVLLRRRAMTRFDNFNWQTIDIYLKKIQTNKFNTSATSSSFVELVVVVDVDVEVGVVVDAICNRPLEFLRNIAGDDRVDWDVDVDDVDDGWMFRFSANDSLAARKIVIFSFKNNNQIDSIEPTSSHCVLLENRHSKFQILIDETTKQKQTVLPFISCICSCFAIKYVKWKIEISNSFFLRVTQLLLRLWKLFWWK